MPTLKVKTIQSSVGWKSDDGEVTSYNIVVDVNGKRAQASTYSRTVAEEGFEGEVESYEKNGHTYLKQLNKENKMWTPKAKFNSRPDNSDGQRQGMCIKAAADYIISQNKSLEPEQFAIAVRDYAKELYKIDLKDVEIEDLDDNKLSTKEIEDIFKSK